DGRALADDAGGAEFQSFYQVVFFAGGFRIVAQEREDFVAKVAIVGAFGFHEASAFAGWKIECGLKDGFQARPAMLGKNLRHDSYKGKRKRPGFLAGLRRKKSAPFFTRRSMRGIGGQGQERRSWNGVVPPSLARVAGLPQSNPQCGARWPR